MRKVLRCDSEYEALHEKHKEERAEEKRARAGSTQLQKGGGRVGALREKKS